MGIFLLMTLPSIKIQNLVNLFPLLWYAVTSGLWRLARSLNSQLLSTTADANRGQPALHIICCTKTCTSLPFALHKLQLWINLLSSTFADGNWGQPALHIISVDCSSNIACHWNVCCYAMHCLKRSIFHIAYLTSAAALGNWGQHTTLQSNHAPCSAFHIIMYALST